tara:strand:- start:638 stop:901 length:264 start_codon:yes stop_codon:yes gene_type:complete
MDKGSGVATQDDVYLPEVLFEFQPKGRYVRVTAIDPRTGIEVVSICDARYSQSMVKNLAIRKLKYVLRKRRAQILGTGRPGRTDLLA